MDRDCLISHGMNAFIKDSMLVRGDQFYVAICNQSGCIAAYNEKNNILLCPFADGPIKFTNNVEQGLNVVNINRHGREFSIIRVPYAFKLLLQELQSMNVQMRIITEDNINQLFNMVKSNELKNITGIENYNKYSKFLINKIQDENNKYLNAPDNNPQIDDEFLNNDFKNNTFNVPQNSFINTNNNVFDSNFTNYNYNDNGDWSLEPIYTMPADNINIEIKSKMKVGDFVKYYPTPLKIESYIIDKIYNDVFMDIKNVDTNEILTVNKDNVARPDFKDEMDKLPTKHSDQKHFTNKVEQPVSPPQSPTYGFDQPVSPPQSPTYGFDQPVSPPQSPTYGFDQPVSPPENIENNNNDLEIEDLETNSYDEWDEGNPYYGGGKPKLKILNDIDTSGLNMLSNIEGGGENNNESNDNLDLNNNDNTLKKSITMDLNK